MISLCIGLAVAFVIAAVYAACLWHDRERWKRLHKIAEGLATEAEASLAREGAEHLHRCKRFREVCDQLTALRPAAELAQKLQEENEMLTQALAEEISKGKPKRKQSTQYERNMNKVSGVRKVVKRK
jgi:Flp pilus assembly protein TadB